MDIEKLNIWLELLRSLLLLTAVIQMLLKNKKESK